MKEEPQISPMAQINPEARGSCPKCRGVADEPSFEECHGCFDCDFTGTLAGYQRMRKMEDEAYEAWSKAEEEHEEYKRQGVCSGCGARSLAEAASRCHPHAIGETGEYGCPGEDLWEGEE